MTSTSFSAAPTNNTDANFRLWGSAFSAALATIGLVQTSDTGQIDWVTVAKPPSGSNYPGYEIWRFDDANQSACPIYLKIEYGSGSSAANPNVRISVGGGSDGAGGIINPNPSNYGTYNLQMASSSTTLYTWLLSLTNGVLTISPCNTDSIFYTWVFSVSRMLDQSSGSPTAKGYFVSGYSATGGPTSGITLCYRKDEEAWRQCPQGVGAMWPFNTGATSIYAGKPVFGACRWTSGYWDRGHDRTLAFVVVSTIDWKPGDIFTLLRWDGTKHRYRVTAQGAQYSFSCIAILWE